jgi:hypothetical protein
MIITICGRLYLKASTQMFMIVEIGAEILIDPDDHKDLWPAVLKGEHADFYDC